MRAKLFGPVAAAIIATAGLANVEAEAAMFAVGNCANLPASGAEIGGGSLEVIFTGTFDVGDMITVTADVNVDLQAAGAINLTVTPAGGATQTLAMLPAPMMNPTTISGSFTVATAGNHSFRVSTNTETGSIDATITCVAAPPPMPPTPPTPTPSTTTTTTPSPTQSTVDPVATAPPPTPLVPVTMTMPQVVQTTTTVIQNTMTARIPGMVSDEPDLVSRLRYRGGDRAASGAMSPFLVSGYANSGNAHIRGKTGLDQIRRAAQVATRKNQAEGSSSADPIELDPPTIETSETDFWLEGRYSRTTTSSLNNQLGIVYASVDHLVTNDVLLGAMLSLDWAEDQRTNGSNGFGRSLGWMVGPYGVIRFGENVYLDARAAWGTSTGDISPFGTYEDSYKTRRWLVRAQLTGDLIRDEIWRVSPMAQFVYFSERQSSYVDGVGNFIDGQNVSLGRITSGIEFARTYQRQNGDVFMPQIALKSVVDIGGTNVTRVNGLASFVDDFHGRVEAGFRYTRPSGHQLSAEVFYDGIANNKFDMIGGRVRLVIPLK
ncbi:MAG: autotransporter outer membrane beta-barrel domain-containing protein [Pseudomonadota bacterium]